MIEAIVGCKRHGFLAGGNSGVPGIELELGTAEQVVGFGGGSGMNLLLKILHGLIDAAVGKKLLGRVGGCGCCERQEAKTSKKEASQTRGYCVAKNAPLRAARPDSSLRKNRLLGMTIRLLLGSLHGYSITFTRAPSVKGLA